MKKKINLELCLVGAFAIILTTIMTMLIFYNVYRNQVFSDLKLYTNVLRQSKLVDELKDTKSDSIALKDIRVTIIKEDGQVLYDSISNPEEMENHINRPEVSNARSNREGTSVRKSDTVGYNMYYYAVRLKDGIILRVAREASSISSLFYELIPLLTLVAMLIFLLCYGVAKILTRKIIKPIETMAEHMDDIENHVMFTELVPFARMIHSQHNDILNKVNKLQEENIKLDLIISNMQEGLLLLDSDKNIISVNPSALHFLRCKEKDYRNKSVLYLTRSEEILECIEKASGRECSSVKVTLNGYELQVYSNPVIVGDEMVGSVTFFVDITMQSYNEKMRQEFSANVSHELKTPLASISGYAELIQNGMVKKEDIGRFAGEIHRSAKRLLQLINDIIRISQLDEADYRKQFVPIDLLQLVTQCKQILSISAQTYGVTIDIEEDCENPLIYGEPRMIEEVVFNLLDNAIRYNHPNGQVLIGVRTEGEKIALSVKDTGIGIPKEYHNRVFERFFRVDKSRSKETGGTGLGLSIVKHVAALHLAEIILESTPDVGTKIIILFPKK